MALECEKSIVAHHAAAIVGNLNQFLPARLHLNPNAGRTGVQRIFQQFFGHGSRTLHYFAGGNLIGDIFREDVDSAHNDGERTTTKREGGAPRIGFSVADRGLGKQSTKRRGQAPVS